MIKTFKKNILKIFKSKNQQELEKKYFKLRKKIKKLKLELEKEKSQKEKYKQLARNYLSEYNIQKDTAEINLKNKENETMQQLLNLIALPLIQINTALVKNQTIETKGIKGLLNQIKNGLQQFNIEFIGKVGEKVLYNETLHQPIGKDNFNTGDKVEVVLEGIKLHNSLIRKAMVCLK